MRRDYGDFKPAMDELIARIEAGAWRHGIKTNDAVKEVIRCGPFLADVTTMWPATYHT
jgi:hypothetical protein